MKYLLLLLFLPTVSSFLYKLSDAEKCATKRIEECGFSQYFAVPMKDDEKTVFQLYTINNETLVWPTVAKISKFAIDTEVSPSICFNNGPNNISGLIYLIEKEFGDMDVFHTFSENVTVQATQQFTVMFSKDGKGFTLGDFQTDSKTMFQIYSGLPDDTHYLLYSYDSTMGLDSIFIQEEYFFVNNTGSKTLTFTFTNKTEIPSEFVGNGLVMAPGFPTKAADGDYLDMTIKMVKDDTTDRLLNVKVTTINPAAGTVENFAKAIILDETPGAGVTITVEGQTRCFVQATGKETTEHCKLNFPHKTESFKVKADNAAYIIQFEATEIPPTTVSTTTEALTTLTTAKGATTTKTCPACPTVTSPVCPTVTTTVCPTITCPTTIISTTTPTIPTTSDPSTTTMGSSTSSVASLILITFIYSLF
ncbi:hypothetical protein L5515_011213 [Caenorhabditis briggsae]|uniref:Uncharacterized protein n=2 Tax=Caenorhabditis briggsae TaxID=6238 RepID=A0AAE9JE43_CAEBR|nr:hypothetical protein L5515_011213 [Caenorhabditis briggsae]